MKKHIKWLILTLVSAAFCLLLIYSSVGESPSAFSEAASQNRDRGTGSLSHSSAEVESGTTNLSLCPTPSPTPLRPTIPSVQPVLNCKYYVENDFMASVSIIEKEGGTAGATTSGTTANTAGSIIGGIVPHHLLAGKLIASFFNTLSESNPETLIIVAPNHRRIGHNALNTSLLDWSTPFGTLETDTEAVNKLASGMNASLSNDLFEKEHSISSLVPYIKYYMPDVKIVPVLLHGNYAAGDASKLGKQLSEELLASKKTVLIASIDFSHYLDTATAGKMDEKTLKAIQAFDFRSISLMGNDNLDSPPSIITLLSAMKEIKADAPEVTGHDNSSDISGKSYNYTTSYYTMFFRHPVQ